jgi:methylenetetrahydrofolate dehydrogenase (NADP+)/methenyltetrahydrofolate cyclohydrolase
MNAQVIDGKAFAARVREQVAGHVSRLKSDHGIVPGLAVVLVGEDPASQVYVRSKGKLTVEVGMHSVEHKLDSETPEDELLAVIDQLNSDPAIHGILVQLPLPKHLNEDLVINSINPAKDVDGFHPINVGNLSSGYNATVPCTPLGCLLLIKKVEPNLSGKHAVIIGRSNLNGKPMAQLLLKENCTVTIVHSKTKDLKTECLKADILVAAVGVANLVKADWVKENSIVIDVGINKVGDKIVGDVEFETVKEKVRAITPVPGGVGPMTIACLLKNTLECFKDR